MQYFKSNSFREINTEKIKQTKEQNHDKLLGATTIAIAKWEEQCLYQSIELLNILEASILFLPTSLSYFKRERERLLYLQK